MGTIEELEREIATTEDEVVKKKLQKLVDKMEKEQIDKKSKITKAVGLALFNLGNAAKIGLIIFLLLVVLALIYGLSR